MKKAILFLTFASLICIICANSYQISNADLNYYVNTDGSIIAIENITYILNSGDFTQLYLQKPPDLEITNATGYCIGANCEFFEQNLDGWHELVLESDFQNEKISAVFEYKIHNQVLSQEDTAQFFYKLWGEQWKTNIDNLKITIHLPPSEYEYGFFLHPPNLNFDVNTSGSKIELISKNHPPNTYVEMNLLLPKDIFHNLPRAQNYMSKEQIIAGEEKYISEQMLMVTAAKFLYLIPILIACISFIFLYFAMGREIPLITLGYSSIYEREPPRELGPAIAGYLVSKSASPTHITSEILMLMHLGFIKSTQKQVEQNFILFKNKKDSIFLSLTNKNPLNLNVHQKLLLNFLKDVQNYAKNNSKLTQDGFEHTQISKYVISSQNTFASKFNSILSKEFDSHLDTNANYIMVAIAWIMLFAQIAIFAIFSSYTLNNLVFEFITIFLTPAFLISLGILPLLMPQILGKWTKNGRVLEQKCLNFKKYLEHFGSFKHKDVAQIKLWEEYLIYATSFGIADKVLSQIEKVYPQIKTNSQTYVYFATFSALNSSYSAYSPPSSGSSSGGFGGGFGGGGGGGGAR